jgi:hypothetical protein
MDDGPAHASGGILPVAATNAAAAAAAAAVAGGGGEMDEGEVDDGVWSKVGVHKISIVLSSPFRCMQGGVAVRGCCWWSCSGRPAALFNEEGRAGGGGGARGEKVSRVGPVFSCSKEGG